jgi:hypothetical protein
MTAISAAELALSVRFNRPPQNGPLTLFAVMRNEMYFLPAFLAHYRRLGIRQFVIVDDASDDGTSAYLAAQPDCCSGMTHIRFGTRVSITDPSHEGLAGRAGPILKRVVPDHYLMGQPVLIADADEFLLLPDALPTVPDVVALMRRRGWKSVAASLIDFYPESLADLEDPTAPATVDELFRRFGCFDAVPFVTLREGRQPARTGPTASERLFRRCGIRQVPPALGFLPQGLARWLPLAPPGAAWYKTPIIEYDGSTFMVASHDANVPPPGEMLLAMAHFKFNGGTWRRIKSAIALKAHARGGQKYEHYEQMLQVMERRRFGFLGPHSMRYRNPQQLLDCGLMKIPSLQPDGAGDGT